MENKVLEFGNYLLSINNDETKKILIEGSIINHPNKLSLINMFRAEDENENKKVVENDIEVKYYSQVNEFIDVFGLENNEEVKNKVLEYLNDLLQYKNTL